MSRIYATDPQTYSEPYPQSYTKSQEITSTPIAQSFYRRIHGTHTWTRTECSPSPRPIPSSFDIVSWCVGYNLPNPQLRITSILTNIQFTFPDQDPGLIFLEDVHYVALDAILVHPWVMENYHPTDVDETNWGGDGSFGTLALVRKDLDVQNVFRVPFSGSTKDALVVDFEDRQGGIVRFVGTSLEGEEDRKSLMAALSLYMPALGSDACRAVLVGEIGEGVQLPKEAMMRDAFLMMGKPDGHEIGWSWGMNCWPEMRIGERRHRGYVSSGVGVKDYGRIGAGHNAPVILNPGGTQATYASENSGIMMMLSNLS